MQTAILTDFEEGHINMVLLLLTGKGMEAADQ